MPPAQAAVVWHCEQTVGSASDWCGGRVLALYCDWWHDRHAVDLDMGMIVPMQLFTVNAVASFSSINSLNSR